jgi:hypothetical protein
MITMIFLTIEASAISGYGTLPGGSVWLAVVPGSVGGCWAGVAEVGNGGGVWVVAVVVARSRVGVDE